MDKISRLDLDKYNARVEVLKYSITFAGAAVAFLITAIEKLKVNLPLNSLKWLLAFWGTAVFTGFVMYMLSYREAWYYHRAGNKWLWAAKIERYVLYLALILHPFSMLISSGLTVFMLWNAV